MNVDSEYIYMKCQKGLKTLKGFLYEPKGHVLFKT